MNTNKAGLLKSIEQSRATKEDTISKEAYQPHTLEEA